MGQKVRVLVDRIDPVEKKIQFALLEEEKPRPPKRKKKIERVSLSVHSRSTHNSAPSVEF